MVSSIWDDRLLYHLINPEVTLKIGPAMAVPGVA
jgi:hypothetical protein